MLPKGGDGHKRGKNELVVDDYAYQVSSFTLMDDADSFRLPPGAFKELSLQFTPELAKENADPDRIFK